MGRTAGYYLAIPREWANLDTD